MLLKEYRDQALGLADLLHCAVLVDEGIILQKDGSFLAGWRYAGPDLDCAGAEELAALSAQVSGALATLGDGWMIHVDAIRAPATDYPPVGAFQDPTTALIDLERRRQYQAAGSHFESRYVLTVTYLPPPSVESRLSSLFVSGADVTRDAWGLVVAFRAALDGIEDLLSARLALARLDSEALLTHLHRCITGLDHPVRVPAIPCYLDALLASQDLVGGFEPKVGDNHIRALSIGGFPMESWPGILDFLNRLPVTYRWSTRFIFMDTETAERRLRIVRRHWFQKRHTFFQLLYQALNPEAQGQGWENKDALEMAEDADEALAEASGGAVRYGYYTATLILMDEDRPAVDAAARTVRKELNNRGFPTRLETVNALEAYLGSLPGHGYQNVRRAPLHTLNLADLLPLTSVWPGREHCPCPFYPPESPPLLVAATAGSTPFRLNLHVGDVGHTLIIGPTGAGKSTIVGLLMAQFFRYPNAQVFCFDKGYSSFPLCQAAGGEHYDIAGESDALGLCPLAHIAKEGERGWAADWLETLFHVQGVKVSPRHRETLTNALRVLAWEAGHSLTDLKNTLQDEDLRRALDPYTLTGPLGGLLDATSDDLGRGRFQVFELEHLMSRGEAQTVPVLTYLFHAIERRLDGRPTLLPLDEGWVMLLHSLFADKVEEWLRTLRKKNCVVLFITQSLADIARHPKRDLILQSCPTKIFLPNPEAGSELQARAYREIGLSDRQIEVLSYAVPKREYLVTSPEGRRLIDLDLGPVALSFVGAGGKEDIARCRRLIGEYAEAWPHAETWPAAWLESRGLFDAARAWRALHTLSLEKTHGHEIAA